MTRQTKATLYGLFAVLCWSTVASAFKISLRYLSAAELLFYATCCSVILLAAILLSQGKFHLLRSADRATWTRSLALGALNPFLYYLILFKAYEVLPAQQAQPINYTWAITLTLLSVPLLGHRLRAVELAAVLISYFGVYIISSEGNLFSFSFAHPLGVALALGSTIIWALYWIMNTRDDRDPIAGLLLNFLCSLPLIGGYLALFEGFRVIPWPGIVGAAYTGCFEMGIAYVAWLMAMKLTSSTARVANLIFLSPFLSLILIHFIVGEHILPSSLIGLIFIMTGLVVQSLSGTGRAGRDR
ncbi:MAG: DMT family transporter [Desulfofustis sp.]|nr:DMT family transporter [Desulfofustis sp.]